MTKIAVEHNDLFFDDKKVWCKGSGGSPEVPASDQKIICLGASERQWHVITIDARGILKIWDPTRPHLDKQRLREYRPDFTQATAAGIIDSGRQMAIAKGRCVEIYCPSYGRDELLPLGKAVLAENTIVVALTFIDNKALECTDQQGNTVILDGYAHWQPKA